MDEDEQEIRYSMMRDPSESILIPGSKDSTA